MDEENGSCMKAQEPAVEAAYAYKEVDMPEDINYARIADGVLQITPDIQEEIAEVERGEVVSLSEFKTMFSKWL